MMFRTFRPGRGDGMEPGRRHAREGFWEGRGRGFGGRGHRLHRLFAHGDLHLVILHLIAEKPRHGYEIIKAVEEMVAGAYSPSPGTVYPALTMLEEQGHIAVAGTEGNRKLYAATEGGQAYLDANRAELETLLARMRHAGEKRRGEDAPQIVRAMENLRLALRLRLERGPLDETQAQAVAAALDRAAGEIETV